MLSHGGEKMVSRKKLATVLAFLFLFFLCLMTPFYVYDHFEMRKKM